MENLQIALRCHEKQQQHMFNKYLTLYRPVYKFSHFVISYSTDMGRSSLIFLLAVLWAAECDVISTKEPLGSGKADASVSLVNFITCMKWVIYW